MPDGHCDDRLQIAHITSHAGDGGDWIFIRSLYQRFTEAGHSVVILGANASQKNSSFTELELNRGLLGFWRSLHRARKIPTTTQIVHAHSFASLAYAIAVKTLWGRSYKIVCTQHLVVNGSALKSFFVRCLAMFTDAFHVGSNVTERFLIDQFRIKPNKIKLAYLGADSDRYRPVKKEEKAALRAKVQIDSGEFVLLFVGRLAPEKGVEQLLSFMANSKSENVTLLIVGDGDDATRLRRLAQTEQLEKSVRFVGKINELEPYYQVSDVLAFPSQGIETFGLVVIEAALCGLPCIMNDQAGVSETIVDGETGFIFETKNQTALEQKIQHAINRQNDLPRIGAKARRTALDRFTHQAMMAGVKHIYQDVLKSKNGVA